jgi:hypothetical protein
MGIEGNKNFTIIDITDRFLWSQQSVEEGLSRVIANKFFIDQF